MTTRCTFLRRAVFFAALLLSLLSSGPRAAAQLLGISPVNVTLKPEERATTFTITNKGAAPTTVQARPFVWSQGEIEDKTDPTEFVVMSPPIFTLAPGESQVIRTLVRKRDPARETTYRVIFDQLPGPKTGGQVQMLLRLNIPIFAEPPAKAEPALAFHLEVGADGKGPTLTLVGVNSGNRHDVVRDAELTLPNGHKLTLDSAVSPYILAGATRRWKVKLDGAPPAAGTAVHLVAKGDNHPIDRVVPVETAR